MSGSPIGTRPRITTALALLSCAAGSMDAIAFLELGNIFTSAMSGNTILLGLAVGQGRATPALHALVALLGYLLGVAVATLPLQIPVRGRNHTLALESVLLAAFAALWAIAGGPHNVSVTYGLIVLSAIAMGMQGAIGRSLKLPGIMTVIFTSTMTAIVGGVSERLLGGVGPLFPELARQQSMTLLVYLGSAIVSGFIATHCLVIMPFVPLAAVVVLISGLRLHWLTFGADGS